MNPLQAIGFVDAENQPLDGLVAVRHPKLADGPHERSIVLHAKTFGKIDYVFFRRFKDAQGNTARSSHVAAYVIDNTRGKKSTKEELADLHHKLWLHAAAPLVYVAWPTHVDILSCARKPDFWDGEGEQARLEYSPADVVHIAADISDELANRHRCSAFRLSDGTFWEEPKNQDFAKDEASAHRSLIQAIVEADQKLEGGQFPLRRRLLVLVILIKYLEDRSVFPTNLFGRFHAGARSILDVMRDGAVADFKRLLVYLEKRFNGDVFSLGDHDKQLTKKELRHLANLVEAKTLGGQGHFWELFDFKHIPVEVISRIYQRFVTSDGAVYTPPLLASLILDQAMPYHSMTGREKILDPSCGSGVFLVGAFKRLVTRWRSTHKWKKPSVDELKNILARSIHGVELESNAVDLTAFSLAIAVCDALEPPVIWQKLKFDKLRGRNIREGDFFDPSVATNGGDHEWPREFDVVVGNPPFVESLTNAAIAVEKNRATDRPKLPADQIAYLFLESCLHILSQGGSVCLIQPHGLLYNIQTESFRKHLLSLARLGTVLDFISIRGMFDEKDPKTVAWHATRRDSFPDKVKHLTFRRTYSTDQRIAFELDHYDRHEITYERAIGDPLVWRINLLGGGRLHSISKRLRKLTTLAEYVTKKDWDYGEGFTVGNRSKKASFLTGCQYLPTRAFGKNGINESQISRVNESKFEAPRDPSRFASPLVLIKENSKLPVAFWDKGSLAYRHIIVGIHAPESERSQLVKLFKILQSRNEFYRFCSTLNGTQALVGKATALLKKDIDRLPMPENLSDIDFCFWERALRDDVLTYMADYVRLGQESDLLSQSARPAQVHAYASLFQKMLGSLYSKLSFGEPIFLNGLIAQPFFFGETPDVSWFKDDCEGALHRLVYSQAGESLRTIRVIRYYDANVILVVKPDRLRYWIESTAIHDADDTLADLQAQGW